MNRRKSGNVKTPSSSYGPRASAGAVQARLAQLHQTSLPNRVVDFEHDGEQYCAKFDAPAWCVARKINGVYRTEYIVETPSGMFSGKDEILAAVAQLETDIDGTEVAS